MYGAALVVLSSKSNWLKKFNKTLYEEKVGEGEIVECVKKRKPKKSNQSELRSVMTFHHSMLDCNTHRSA